MDPLDEHENCEGNWRIDAHPELKERLDATMGKLETTMTSWMDKFAPFIIEEYKRPRIIFASTPARKESEVDDILELLRAPVIYPVPVDVPADLTHEDVERMPGRVEPVALGSMPRFVDSPQRDDYVQQQRTKEKERINAQKKMNKQRRRR